MDNKFNYFIERTEKDISEIKLSNEKMHEKLDNLLQFKWQLLGGATVVAALVSVVISLIEMKLKQ